MNRDDHKALAKEVAKTAHMMGTPIDADIIAGYLEELDRFPLAAVVEALRAIRRDPRARLSIGAVLERVDPGQGHISANEAWAIAQHAEDERNTVVWTMEIQRAWHVAQPLVEGGDKVAARMAFLEAYARLVNEARMRGERGAVFVSHGWDASTTAMAIQRARSTGLISVEDGAQMLRLHAPRETLSATVPGGLGGLIATVSDRIKDTGLSDRQRAELEALKRDLRQGERRRLQALADQHARERAELEALRQKSLDDLARSDGAQDGQ